MPTGLGQRRLPGGSLPQPGPAFPSAGAGQRRGRSLPGERPASGRRCSALRYRRLRGRAGPARARPRRSPPRRVAAATGGTASRPAEAAGPAPRPMGAGGTGAGGGQGLPVPGSGSGWRSPARTRRTPARPWTATSWPSSSPRVSGGRGLRRSRGWSPREISLRRRFPGRLGLCR